MHSFTSRLMGPIVTAALGTAMFGALVSAPYAQVPVHLNPMIETLARGDVAFGVSNEDLSLATFMQCCFQSLDRLKELEFPICQFTA